MGLLISSVVAWASFYSLLAAGYVVLYRTTKWVNLAHGEFAMLGGYLLFVSATFHSFTSNVVAAVVLSLGGTVFLGLLLYYVFMRPMLGQPVFAPVMITIALSTMLRSAATLIWGPTPVYPLRELGLANPPFSFTLLGTRFTLSGVELLQLLAAILCLSGLALFFKYTRFGAQMRGVAENPRLASLRRINVNRFFIIGWGISVALASVGGMLYSSNVYLNSDIGFVGIKVLIVALIGGLNSMAGIVPAAFIVAAAEVIIARYADPLLSGVIPMMIGVLVLIVYPWGLFGRKEEIERV